MFLQIKESGDSRIVVDGQPGSGKTTFVKRICYIWAQRFHGRAGYHSTGKLEEYTIVLPIILKFICNENTLTNIFSSQLECLNICEVCAVINYQEENPKDIVLLLDGFDEYTGKSFIENLILNKEYPDVLCITTSRSHAIEQIKRHSSQAVQQHVRLCGFSKDQVKTYIEQFCQCYGLSANTAEDLIKTLNRRSDLLEVAKVPIRTEMICTVWAVYRRLGDTLADLYQMFILHLITHWDKKVPSRSRVNKHSKLEKLSEENIWNDSQPLLIKVGKLANSWTKQYNLCSMYNDTKLAYALREDYEKVINIGLLTKSYPTSAIQASKWSFPHLTFQEYFVAYLLGNDTKNDYVTGFTQNCKQHHYRVLKKCEMIFTFLVNKYSATANKIITQLLREETDKMRCEELFDIICDLFQQFESEAVEIPLPCHLNLDSNKILNFKVLNLMFEADQRQKESNMKHLSTDNPIKFKKFLDILTITELNVTACNNEELNLVSLKLRQLCHLTSLSINSTVSFFLPDHDDVLKSIPETKLRCLSITGPGALESVAENIHRFTSVDQLEVAEISNPNNKTYGQKILSALKGHKFLKQVKFSVMDLDDIIIKEDADIKVMVRVKKLHPGTKVTSDMFTGESNIALHSLNLNGNNLEHEGRLLGELVTKVSGLRVLSLADCTLKPQTIQKMVDAMTNVQFTSHIQTLKMGHYEKYNRNKLCSAGPALGKLLKHMPDLQILDLEECNLKSEDFEAMSDVMSGTFTKLLTLNLGVNDLGEANKGGCQLLQYMPELSALKAGGYNSADPIPAICGAVETGALAKLNTLDVSESVIDSNNLSRLSEQLHLMTCLKALSLKGLEGVKQDDYNNVYKNIPSWLTHLNITMTEEATIDIYEILNNKNRLSKMLRLNVTLTDSDLEMLQEQLGEINTDIKVYNKAKENIWRIYVDK